MHVIVINTILHPRQSLHNYHRNLYNISDRLWCDDISKRIKNENDLI